MLLPLDRWIFWFGIFPGSLCNSSHFHNGEGGSAVGSIPFQEAYAAGATRLRFHSLFLSHTRTHSDVPPSVFASFILTLPPTHLLYLPKRAQIQLSSGSSGRQTQLCRYKGVLICNMSSIKGVPSLEAKATALTKNINRNAAVSVLITDEAWQEISCKKGEQHMCNSRSSTAW